MTGQADKRDRQFAQNAKPPIGTRIERGMEKENKLSWQHLRSDIYIRDKGMCWICNTFVNLDEYHLGHLVDRANGGQDAYDNLAVMHKVCNKNKPYHETLEECLKWKLTAFMPAIQQARGIATHSPIMTQHIRHIYPVKESTKRKPPKPTDQKLLARITTGTLCWIQGRPHGAGNNTNTPMWKVLPPPYKQEDLFTIRETPPGATDNGQSSIYDTLQIIGDTLTQEIDIDLGHHHIHIVPNGDNTPPSITLSRSNQSNNDRIRGRTVGIGKGQIPLEEWYNARAQGITFKDFMETYSQEQPISTGHL